MGEYSLGDEIIVHCTGQPAKIMQWTRLRRKDHFSTPSTKDKASRVILWEYDPAGECWRLRERFISDVFSEYKRDTYPEIE